MFHVCCNCWFIKKQNTGDIHTQIDKNNKLKYLKNAFKFELGKHFLWLMKQKAYYIKNVFLVAQDHLL